MFNCLSMFIQAQWIKYSDSSELWKFCFRTHRIKFRGYNDGFSRDGFIILGRYITSTWSVATSRRQSKTRISSYTFNNSRAVIDCTCRTLVLLAPIKSDNYKLWWWTCMTYWGRLNAEQEQDSRNNITFINKMKSTTR